MPRPAPLVALPSRVSFRALALPLLAALAAFAGPPSGAARAQDFNVTRLSRLDQHFAYNDVWGYVAPDGREYALLGTRDGLAVVDATDPIQPVEVGFFAGPNCLWRDIKTWGARAYEVNDCTSGVRVIDLSDPAHPFLVTEFGLSKLGHVHNIQVDTQTGKLYACGTNAGLAIYDLAADPVNPPLVTTWNGQGIPGSIGYVHDVYVKDGLAHAGMINDGLYAILDVSALPQVQVVSATLTGVDFAHSTWTTADGHWATTADEKTGNRNLQLWDISDPAHPLHAASLSQGPGTIPHNPFIRGNVLHASYYKLGYIAFDISDPQNPVKIGQHKTLPSDDLPDLFQGAWGCYPFMPSGFIYVSDIKGGLLVLKLNPSCPADPSGRPVVCETWPAVLPSTGQASPQVLLTGATLADATSVHVGDTVLGPGSFTSLDDQVLAFPMPAVPEAGLVAVRVGNAAGLSDPVWLPVHAPGGPELVSGAQAVPVGGTIQHVLHSQPGDLQFLAFSTEPVPSHSPKVDFAIGNGFTSLFLFPPLVADGTGTTTLPPIEVPSAGAGLTVYWQFAAVGQPASFPAPASNATISVLGP